MHISVFVAAFISLLQFTTQAAPLTVDSLPALMSARNILSVPLLPRAKDRNTPPSQHPNASDSAEQKPHGGKPEPPEYTVLLIQKGHETEPVNAKSKYLYDIAKQYPVVTGKRKMLTTLFGFKGQFTEDALKQIKTRKDLFKVFGPCGDAKLFSSESACPPPHLPPAGHDHSSSINNNAVVPPTVDSPIQNPANPSPK